MSKRTEERANIKAAQYRILVPVVQSRDGKHFHEQGKVVSLSWMKAEAIKALLENHRIEEVE